MTNNPKDIAQSKVSNIPHQLIIFGPPGTGKSYKIHGRTENAFWQDSYAAKLDIASSEQIVNAVFHPEYTYGDFMGRLLPTSTADGGKVKYGYRPGHFLIALSEAYNLLYKGENVLLVIDELNRGNAAAIFGSVFNLLDRNEDGWSSYPISLSNMEYESFLQRLVPEAVELDIAGAQVKMKTNAPWTCIGRHLENFKERLIETKGEKDRLTFKVQLPPNLYIRGCRHRANRLYMASSIPRAGKARSHVLIQNQPEFKQTEVGAAIPDLTEMWISGRQRLLLWFHCLRRKPASVFWQRP